MNPGKLIGLIVSAALVTTLAGCATELRPAPGTQRIDEGPGVAAVATASDVRVEARVDAWRWPPDELGDELTPLHLTIENQGETPLRVRFEDMALVGRESQRWIALPPFDIEEDVQVTIQPEYPARRFHYAPHLARRYRPGGVYGGAFFHDPIYYSRNYPRFVDIDLPTVQMLVRAMPEGVIDPGGRLEGFVYFEHVEDPKSKRVDLQIDLIDADSGARFGRVEVPFVAK